MTLPKMLDGMGVVTHRVVWGDTLPSISAEYFGTVDYAREIWEMNRHTIQTPNSLVAGMVIVLPHPENYHAFTDH